MCLYVSKYVCVCMCVCECMCVYVYVCVCVCICMLSICVQSGVNYFNHDSTMQIPLLFPYAILQSVSLQSKPTVI